MTTLANPALTNERLGGAEVGLDWVAARGLSLSATAFTNRLAPAVANVTIGANLRQRQNVDAIRARGVELTVAAARGAFTFDASLALTGAVVEASGAAAGLNGLRPAQTPRFASSGSVGWRPREGWLLSAVLRRVGAQFEDDQQTYVLPGATVLGGVAIVPLRPAVQLVLRVENLTDAAVQTRNQAGSIDLDRPRTVWVGLRLSARPARR